MLKRQCKKQLTIPAGIAIGIACSVLFSIAAAALIASLIAGERIEQRSVSIAVIAIQFFSSVFGAWLASVLSKQRKLLVCLCSGGGYILILLACTALFFGSQYKGFLGGVLAVFIGCICVAFIGLKSKKASRIRKRKPVYR